MGMDVGALRAGVVGVGLGAAGEGAEIRGVARICVAVVVSVDAAAGLCAVGVRELALEQDVVVDVLQRMQRVGERVGERVEERV